MTPMLYVLSICFLPEEFDIGTGANIVHVKNYYMFFCATCGLWTGLLIGYTTEYYTSNTYAPVRGMADQCKTSAATNIIAGLAVGYKSAVIPVIAISITIFVAYKLAGMFGIGIGALGILSTLAIGLTIDAYGPIADNAGGIVEMAELGKDIRTITDNLDAAGNTTAAIGKGFAIASAALVSLALFGAYTTQTGIDKVDILQPAEFAGLLLGAMLPYAFSAMTMKSVGDAAQEMVEEVRRQFTHKRTLSEEAQADWVPDYQQCIMISTISSLREMIAPGVLVMGTPLLIGICFGTHALAGLLSGSLVSSVQLALSMSNTGGAWDNTKKYIESGALGEGHGKKTATHDAAVTGDTVGDPLKDTSGPALNILMKLAAVESLVFAPFFLYIKNGEGLYGYFG
jgi:inorganic pyrophosphatase